MEGTMSEVRFFAGNFEPSSWAFCNGQAIGIANNTALYALLGTIYGGDGIQTFALPDFRGRVAVGVGTGIGLQPIQLGSVFGLETTTLTAANLATHNHIVSGAGSVPVNGTFSFAMNVSSATGGSNPSAQFLGTDGSGSGVYDAASSGTDTLNANAITVNTSGLSANVGSVQLAVAGSSQPVSNMQPYLVLNYIIAVEGIFPSRN